MAKLNAINAAIRAIVPDVRFIFSAAFTLPRPRETTIRFDECGISRLTYEPNRASFWSNAAFFLGLFKMSINTHRRVLRLIEPTPMFMKHATSAKLGWPELLFQRNTSYRSHS